MEPLRRTSSPDSIEFMQHLARRYPPPYRFGRRTTAAPARATHRLMMRYQYGVTEYFDEHGDVVRVDYGDDDPYGGGRFGAVPASEVEIARLPQATVGEARETDCVVCLEGFEEGVTLRMMTCPSSHGFHEDCIFKWLRVSRLCRLCPLCHFALPAEQAEEAGSTLTL